MFSTAVVRSSHCLRTSISSQIRRNICVSSVLSQKATAQNPPDLIQQLFVSKIREYSDKSKAAGGKLVDADPQAEAALKQEMEKLATQFQTKGTDFTKFPKFEFKNDPLDPINTDEKMLDMFEEPAEETHVTEEDEVDIPDLERYYGK